MALTKVSTDGVKDDAITKTKIPANQIEASELADNAVDTNAIADQAVALSKLPHGDGSSDGKFLRANNGADPSFETVTSTTINNNADNRVITGSGSANTLNGEANLTFDGGNLISKGDNGISIEASSTSTAGRLTIIGVNASDQVSAISRIQSVSTGSNNAATATTFSNRNASNVVNEHMRITSTGKVGIGTTSPVEILHIKEGTNKNVHFTGGIGQIGNVTGFYAVNDANNAIVDIGMTGSTVRFGTTAGERGRFTGDGLCFNGDTAAANALDDYEEGSWTPVIGSGSTTNIYSPRYTKIGNLCTISFSAYGFSDNSSSTALYFTGLPFTSDSQGGAGLSVGACFTAKFSVESNIISYVGASTTTIRFYDHGTGDYDAVRHNNINGTDTTHRIFTTITYTTA